jgi:branched-chain amino acid transport system permease protein
MMESTQTPQRSRALIAFAILLVLLIAAPFFLYPLLVVQILCFALFASSFNLLFGYSGLLSFGHSAFFGAASYVAAYLAKEHGLAPELAIVSAVSFAAIMGAVFGLIAIRRQGIYFAMITLGLAQMFYFLCVQADWFSGGENGIQAVPRGKFLGLLNLADDKTLYLVVACIFFAGILFIYRVVHSPFGRILKIIRDNEPRAISLGYDTQHYKLIAYILSASLTGVAGATKAIAFQFATLTDVHWSMSAEPVLMTLVGGLGTFSGPVVGAAIIVTMQNALAGLGAWVLFLQGFIFALCVLVLRDGVVGVCMRAYTAVTTRAVRATRLKWKN